MKILVTGADGFIGSHLTEALVADGHDVRAMVYYNALNSWGWLDHSPVGQQVEIFMADVRDAVCVRNAAADCDLIFHLAALIGIPYSYHAPQSYVDTNVVGTLNVVQAARDLGGIRVVQMSTSEVYGTAQSVPMTEEHRLKAQSPYAATKIAADQIALSYHLSFDLPVVVARPFNTYGPRQSNRAVIPTVIGQIANGVGELKLGELDPTRDFSFVGDTVRGLMALGRSDNAVGEVINLGSDFEISIGDLVELIAEVMEADIAVKSDAERQRPDGSEVKRLWASNEKAKRLIGWTPSFAGHDGLRRGLEQTVEWFRDPANLAAYKTDQYVV